MPLEWFGSRAERVARSLGVPNALVCNLDALPEAHPRVCEKRAAGDLFYGMLLWEHPRAVVARDVAPSIVAQVKTLDGRRIAFELLAQGKLEVGGKPNGALGTVAPLARQLGWEFPGLVSAQLFWSVREVRAYAEFFGRHPARYETFAAPHRLPEVSHRGTGEVRIVIWAPDTRAEETALIAAAFEELRGEAYVVCAEGVPPDVRAHYVFSGDPRIPDLLSGASCIVDASLSDPGAALGFAKRGFPLAVAATSGADEWVRGAHAYEPWDAQSLYHSALRACAGGTRLRERAIAPLPELRVSERTWERAPARLVSIVVPTYRRPDELDGWLACVERQTYPNVQAVIVNDGGPSVRDVCDRYPGVNKKLIELPQNVGMTDAVNTGFRAADGDYFFALADDDRIFPDHVERLVEALTVSGARVAYSNCLIRYRARDTEGVFRDYGFNATLFTQDADPTTALASPNIHPACCMAAREMYEGGVYATDIGGLSDNELLLRFILKADAVHVDHFTVEMVTRVHGEHYGPREYSGERGVENLRKLYARYPSARPLVQEARQGVIRTVAARKLEDPYIFPPTFVLPEPVP